MPCTEAQKKAAKKWRDAHKDYAKERVKEWQTNNRERYNQLCLRHYHKKNLPNALEKARLKVIRLESMRDTMFPSETPSFADQIEMKMADTYPPSPVFSDDEDI